MPKISVIVPVYNVEKYLHECVNSILAQTYTDFELILVDDGSPDNCPAICDDYAGKDSRIKVIHQENQGPSGARNAGLDIANGEFVTFVDSDDMLHPRFLELLHTAADENDADVSVCSVKTFDNTDEFESIPEPEFERITGKEAARQVCTSEKWMPIVCNKLYKRSLFADVCFPPHRFHEDEAVSYVLMYKAQQVIQMPYKLYHYRNNPNSIMNNIDLQKYYDKAKAYAERYAFFCEHNENELAAIAERSLRISSAKYSIAAKLEGKCANAEFSMPVSRAMQTIKRECSEDNYEWWLSQLHPFLLRGHSYLKKIRSILK